MNSEPETQPPQSTSGPEEPHGALARPRNLLIAFGAIVTGLLIVARPACNRESPEPSASAPAAVHATLERQPGSTAPGPEANALRIANGREAARSEALAVASHVDFQGRTQAVVHHSLGEIDRRAAALRQAAEQSADDACGELRAWMASYDSNYYEYISAMQQHFRGPTEAQLRELTATYLFTDEQLDQQLQAAQDRINANLTVELNNLATDLAAGFDQYSGLVLANPDQIAIEMSDPEFNLLLNDIARGGLVTGVGLAPGVGRGAQAALASAAGRVNQARFVNNLLRIRRTVTSALRGATPLWVVTIAAEALFEAYVIEPWVNRGLQNLTAYERSLAHRRRRDLFEGNPSDPASRGLCAEMRAQAAAEMDAYLADLQRLVVAP